MLIFTLKMSAGEGVSR